jgi:hypothetical protein
LLEQKPVSCVSVAARNEYKNQKDKASPHIIKPGSKPRLKLVHHLEQPAKLYCGVGGL